jgi:hypothetical protein
MGNGASTPKSEVPVLKISKQEVLAELKKGIEITCLGTTYHTLHTDIVKTSDDNIIEVTDEAGLRRFIVKS